MTKGQSQTRPSRTPAKPTGVVIEDMGVLEDDEDLTVEAPGFKTTQIPGPDPLDPTTTTVTGPAGPAGASDAGSDELSGPTTSTTPSGRSSRASSDALPGLTEIAHTLVALASLVVRTVRARTLRRPLAPGVWLADTDDQTAIGDPLARIASRHAPIGGKGSEDVVDGVAALVGVTGYAMRSLEAEDIAPDLVDLDPGPVDATP